MSHVFISYVHENSGIVDRIARALSDNGITVWVDRRNIFPGMLWKDAIKRAIREGAFFIACFSAEAERQERSYMREEIAFAIDELRLRSLDKSWFIPVLINETSIPSMRISNVYDLTDIHFVKLYENWDSAIQLLIQVIKSDDRIRDEHDRLSWMRMIQLTTDPIGERLRAIQALGNTKKPTKEALEALIQACRDDNILIKIAAVEALGCVGKEASNAVGALCELLRESRFPRLQYVVVDTLGRIGPGASGAIPALAALRHGPEYYTSSLDSFDETQPVASVAAFLEQQVYEDLVVFGERNDLGDLIETAIERISMKKGRP